MALDGNQVLALMASLVAVLVGVFGLFLRRRYILSLRQLGRLSAQLGRGALPSSYYVDGPATVTTLARNLEQIGARLAQLQNREQEETVNLNVLLANMVEGVMVVDARHIVRLVNDEMLRLFGLGSSPLGRTVLEALREARVELIVRETLRRNEPRQEDLVLEGAQVRHFEVSAVPIRPKTEGSPAGVVLVFHDVTRLRRLEALRSEFVANVSHELRTPLAIFRGYLETLWEHPGLPPADLKRILEAMRRHSERLNALVEDLLVLARIEARQIQIEPSLVRPHAFFRQMLDDWRQRAGAPQDCEVELDAPADLPPLEVDPLRFEQVILNLLENAVAYSNPPRRIAITVARLGGEIEVRVRDNGIGIPPADLPRIFERFYRVDKGRSRASGGTGLGLSIAKQMIEAHHGSVGVESEVGKGTTIILRLPVNDEEIAGRTAELPEVAAPDMGLPGD